jgi:phosphate transport system permease protein
MKPLWRRNLADRGASLMVHAVAIVALVPLGLVLLYTTLNGLPAASHAEFFMHVQRPVGIPGGGVLHAIAGTIVMVMIASLMAIPVGVISGVFLVEYALERLARWVSLAVDVLAGTPSIAIGLFAYALLVAPFKHFSGLSGSFALAVLMLPVVSRTTQGALSLISGGLRESGLALGLPRWRVALQLVLPAAAPGVITGALLAAARAAGETAPILFTGFGNVVFNLDPTKPMAALPLIVFQNAGKPYEQSQQEAWGAALVLVTLVLLVNITTRLVLRRQTSRALAG